MTKTGLNSYLLSCRATAIGDIRPIECKTRRLQEMTDDFSSNIATKGVISVGGTARGAIEVSGDEDWFAVTLRAGASYLFEGLDARSAGGTISSINMYVYSQTATQIESSFIGDYININPTVTGTYYLAIRSGLETGTYSLRLTEGPKDDYAGNRTTTGILTVGNNVTGTIGIINDVDWLAVSLEAGKTYLFAGGDARNSLGTLRTIYMNLYGASNSYIESSDGTGYIEYTPSQTGTYYLSVASFPGQFETGNYAVALSQGPNDDYPASRGTTGRIDAGSEVRGNIGVPTDHDWFGVDLEAGLSYLVKVSDASSNGGTLPTGYINIYNAAGSYIGSGSNSEYYIINPTISAKFFVSVSSFPGQYSTGTYTISLSKPVVDDYSSNILTTGRLTLGTTATGTIELASDKDWFALDVEAGKSYIIEGFDASSQGGTLSSIRFELNDSTGSTFFSNRPIDLSGNRYIYTPEVNEKLFISISSGLIEQTGTYSLKASIYNTPVVSISAPMIVEGAVGSTQRLDYVITLSTPAPDDVFLVFSTSSGGTASSTVDFNSVQSREVRINRGSTSATVSVNVVGDNLVEENETVEATLSNLSSFVRFSNGGASLKTLGTIISDDLPSLTIMGTSINEGSSDNLTYTAILSNASTSSITFVAKSSNATAVAGVDYSAIEQTITIPAGSTRATVEIPIIRDRQVEATETVILTLSHPTGAVFATNTTTISATGSIVDDDVSTGLALSYRALNPDLSEVFGKDYFSLILHYIQYGRAEGRAVGGFNPEAYAALNPDLFRAFGLDTDALLSHYLSNGRFEQRKSDGFDALAYAARNPDLFAAFGTDRIALVDHYVRLGAAEKRLTTGFDVDAYAAMNPDLFMAFGSDEVAMVNHFVRFGAAEGRRAAGFDVETYAALNSDLFMAFGLNQAALIDHYVRYGKAEGRAASFPSPSALPQFLSMDELPGVFPGVNTGGLG